MTSHRRRKASVQLTAYDNAGQPVLEQTLPYDEYCEGSHPLLDDPSYRNTRGIVRLRGIITDSKGNNSQEFDVRFDQSGRCLSEAARFADGTVAGDWELLHD